MILRGVILSQVHAFRRIMKKGRKMLRIAMLSYHTCSLATLGVKGSAGVKWRVRNLSKRKETVHIGQSLFTILYFINADF